MKWHRCKCSSCNGNGVQRTLIANVDFLFYKGELYKGVSEDFNCLLGNPPIIANCKTKAAAEVAIKSYLEDRLNNLRHAANIIEKDLHRVFFKGL